MASNLTNFSDFSTDILLTEATNVNVSKDCNDLACNGVECSSGVTSKDDTKPVNKILKVTIAIPEKVQHIGNPLIIQAKNQCLACSALYEPSGWVDLCNRRCYYDMCGILSDYESGKVSIPEDRVVRYFTKNPDSGGHWFEPSRIFDFIADQNHLREPSHKCFVCEKVYEPWGWPDLCNRGCYYNMGYLLSQYEEGRVLVPDERVVRFFTRNPNGGRCLFFPERIFEFIADKKRASTGQC
jgi:hypothetical protein